MKRKIKRNMKRWLAFLLAVTLVISACVYSSSDGFLWATSGDTVSDGDAGPADETQVLVIPSVSEGDAASETTPGEEDSQDSELTPGGEDSQDSEGVPGEEGSQDSEEVPGEEGSQDSEEIPGEEDSQDSETAPEEAWVEVPMPAQTLYAVAEDGANITVAAPEGALPEGATVQASVVYMENIEAAVENAVNAEGKDLVNFKAYDITIYDKNGNEIQPKGNVNVSIQGAGVEGDTASVYHVEGGSADKVADVASGDSADFTAGHFSIYVVAGGTTQNPEAAQLKVTVRIIHVYGDENTAMVPGYPYVMMADQAADKTYPVNHGLPAADGYDVEANLPDGLRIENGVLTGAFAEGTTEEGAVIDIRYVARPASYTVRHLYEKEDGTYETLDEETLTGKVGTLTEAKAQDKTGYEGYAVQTITQQVITSDNAAVVEVKYNRVTYILTYNSMGGSYVPSVEAKAGSRLTLASGDGAPQRAGYAFDGWAETEGGDSIGDSVILSKDTVLYARWTAADVTYKLVYLTENADDDDFSYVGTVENMAAKTGDVVTADANSKKPAGFNTKDFTFKDATTETAAADGSTVVIVRYSRNVYTITFPVTDMSGTPTCGREEHKHTYTDSRETGSWLWKETQYTGGCYGSGWSTSPQCGKSEHTHGSDCYKDKLTITAKYEANIKDQWMALVGPGTAYENCQWTWEGSYQTSLQTKMPSGGKVITKKAENERGTLRKLIYYVEVSSDTTSYNGKQTISYNGKTFGEYASYQMRFSSDSYPTYNEEFMEIDGYERFASNITAWKDGKNNGGKASWAEPDNKFYYTRTDYTLQLVNGSGGKTHTVPYTASIAEYLETPSYNPLGDGVFDGWYVDPAFSEKYNGDKTMPKGLVLYAKWSSVKYEVSYKNAEDDNVYKTETVDRGKPTSYYHPEDRPGYIFVGWYTDKECTQRFDSNAPITGNTTIYAKWQPKSYTSYKVVYTFDDGTPDEESEPQQSTIGQRIQVKAPAKDGYVVTAPAVQSIVLDVDETKNVITFEYRKVKDLKYQVKYVNENGTEVHRSEIFYSDARSLTIYADGVTLDSLGYVPAPGETSKSVTLETGMVNVIEFKCQRGTYTITYQGIEGVTAWKDGSGANPNKTQYTFGDEFSLIAPEDKADEVFIGWDFTTPNGTVDVAADPHNPANTVIGSRSHGNLIFTARWARLNVSGYQGVYDGTDHFANAWVTGADGFEVYYIVDGEESVEAPSIKDVGEISVRVEARKEDYITLVKTVALKVEQRPYTVITPGAEKEYDGTPLTKSEGARVEGLAEGETASVNVTGSQTDVGESSNTYSEIIWETAKESNYKWAADQLGTLKVTENRQEITVVTTGGTFTYDGKPHGAAVEVEGELPKGYTLVTAASSASATDVTDTAVKATADLLKIVNEAGKDVTNQLNINYVDGSIIINKAPLTIKTPSASKAYDGKALTAAGGEGYGVLGLVNDETVEFAITGSRTTVGTSSNTYSLVWNGTAKESNYDVSEEIGTLTVTKSEDEIVVSVNGGTYPYDGQEHRANISVTNLPEGYTYEAVSNAVQKDAGSVTANCDSLIIRNDENQVLDLDGLNITYANNGQAQITVTPKELTVVTNDGNKTYDGEALEGTGSISGFVEGESAAFTVTGSQTEVGSSKNGYSIDWNRTEPETQTVLAKESNYAVNEVVGTLTVNEYKQPITVTTTNETFTYDGKPHGAKVNVSQLPKGYYLESASSNATATDATATPVKAMCDELVIKNESGVDVTDKLTINYVNGSIAINPAVLKVTTESANKVYDGEPLRAGGKVEGFVNGETARYTITGSRTEVGESDNTYEIHWNEAEATAKQSNYKLDETIGKLTVTQYADEIVVTVTGGAFPYDGQPHGADVTISPLPAGYYVDEIGSSATVTDVEDGEVTATCDNLVIRNMAGDDVTTSLKINRDSNAEIKIVPAKLTVTTNTASKVYDGDPLVGTGSISGFVNNEGAYFEVTGTLTEVGKIANGYVLDWRSVPEGKNQAKASNYDVTENLGSLEVTEFSGAVTVTAKGGEFTYDGEAHGAVVEVTGLPSKGYTVETASSNVTVTDVTEHPVPVTCDNLVIRNEAGEDVTRKLNVNKVDDAIIINPKELTVETFGDSKVYDGEALTAGGRISGFVKDEDALFEVTGSQTAAGSSQNTYVIRWGQAAPGKTEAKQGNYTIKDSLGILTVTESENEIVVTVTGGEFTYDGQAHGAKVEVSALPTGYRVEEVSSSARVTNVEEGAVTAICDKLIIVNAQGVDVTDSLNIVGRDSSAEIKIVPAPLTVTTQSASKVYDGDPLTAEGEISGFAQGEKAVFTVTGSQTAVGDSQNSYDIDWNNAAEGMKQAKESNYVIVENLGTLTVTEYEGVIRVATTGGTFVYDGEAHGATVEVTGLPKGYSKLEATSNAAFTDVTNGAMTVTCDNLVIVNQQGVDVTSKLKYTREDGTITVVPAELKVVTDSDSKVYDGKALRAEGRISGFVKNESAVFAVTGSQTAVGSSENGYKIDWTKAEPGKTQAKADNYKIVEELGTLTVTENEDQIIVTVTGGTFTYDGLAHGAKVEVSALPEGYHLEEASSSQRVTDVEDGVVTARCDRLVIRNEQGVDVTADLNIDRTATAEIRITPATLTVVTNTASKVYDGEPLRGQGQIEGFVNNEAAGFEVTGSLTDVGGPVENGYRIDWDTVPAGKNPAKASNYVITDAKGTLTVTEYDKEITVTTTGGTFTYNGQEHAATVSVSPLPAGYSLQESASNARATDVTNGAMHATCDKLVIVNAKGEDVTAKLNIKKEDGTITVNPAVLTVVTEGADKVYDGTALTADGSIEGFVNGESAPFRTTGSQTAVGGSDNTYEIAWNAEGATAKEGNYTVNAVLGRLEVKQYADEIIVTVTGGAYPYDGQEHGAVVTVSDLPSGYTLEKAVSNARVTNVEEGIIEATCDELVIRNAQGEDVTNELKIRYSQPAQISITPAELTVVTKSAEKVYNGEPLTAEGSIEGFVNGEGAYFEVTGTLTDVGEDDNSYRIDWSRAAEGKKPAKESNYTINAAVGKLKVTHYAGEIKVITTGGEFTYDGKEHAASVSVTPVPEGYSVRTKTTNAKATDVTNGAIPATCDNLVIVNKKGEDVTSQLNITKVDGTITITPAELTVVTKGDSKVYDGTALKAEGSIKGFVNGESAPFRVTGSQTAVGTSDNTYEIGWNSQNATAKEGNYVISETIGKLVVTEYEGEIVVTVTGKVFPYDGLFHGASVDVVGLPAGYHVGEASSSARVRDVDDGEIRAVCDTLVILNEEGKDVTEELNIKNEASAPISISPKKLTVVTDSAKKTYDGTALTAEGRISGFVTGESAAFSVTGSRTDVGTGDNAYVIDWTKAEAGTVLAKESNYEVDAAVGTLEVMEYVGEITVTTTGGSFTYDGDEHGATVAVEGLPAGYSVQTAASSAKAKNVSDGRVYATSDNLVIVNAAGTDVTDRLNIKKVDGSIVITPAELTVTTQGGSKVYDGTALEAAGSISGFVKNESAPFRVTGSQTAVGNSDNTYEIGWGEAGATAQESNYTVKESIGKLIVTEYADQIVVTVTGGEFTYDGKEHGARVDVSALPVGYRLVEASSGARVKDVDDGEVEAVCDTLKIVNAQGQDVTGLLNIVNDGRAQIKVTPAKLNVTTQSGERIYNGQALTAGGEISGFVNNETAAFAVIGAQILVGSSSNVYSLEWNGSAKESNYVIDETLGTLTVTDGTAERPVDPELILTKRGRSAEYEPGDTASFTIRVTNIYDKDTEVRLTELEGVVFDAEPANVFVRMWQKVVSFFAANRAEAPVKTIKLAPGETKEIKVSYTITEDDVVAGGFTNIVTADLEGKTYEARASIDTAIAEGRLEVTKQAADPDKKYALGEEIVYTIRVKNVGNLTWKDIQVTDELTQDVFTIEELAPGEESEEFRVTYVVTEEDIAAGQVRNVAVAGGGTPQGPKEDEGEEIIRTEDLRAHVTVSKTVVDQKAIYELGDTIEYVITATNDGNITAKNILVEDELTGNTAANGNAFMIAELAPGESAEAARVSYVVTEEDIRSQGSIIRNVATAAGETGIPDPEDPDRKIPLDVTPGVIDVTKESENPSLSIVKTADKTGNVALGEVITYTITVVNNGNVTIEDITVEDALTGNVGADALMNKGALAPGESESFTVTYTVTEADILAGKVANTATVSGVSPEGEKPNVDDENTAESETEPIRAEMNVSKRVLNPQEEYAIGDVIRYEILITNDGNVSIPDVVVTDQLIDATGEVVYTDINGISAADAAALGAAGITLNADNTVTIADLAREASVTLHCEYTVPREDAGNDIVNTVKVTGDPVVPTDPEKDPVIPEEKEDITEPTDVQDAYNLIIHYVYSNGTEAAPDVRIMYLEGETFVFYSPAIEGYTPDFAFIRTGGAGMPAQDIELTVTYELDEVIFGPRPVTPVPVEDEPEVVAPVIPVVPVIPVEPVEPTVPVGPGPVVPIEEENVPLGGEIGENEEGEVVIIPVEDDEVPLAPANTGHKCCMLHFLMMLAALIIYGFYTKSMKKHQKRIAELTGKYDTEMIGRKSTV